MNVEQPWILNRPKRVNAEATGLLPRRSKDVKQRVCDRPLITGARMKPGKEVHLLAVCLFVAHMLLPGMRRPYPLTPWDRVIERREAISAVHTEMVTSPTAQSLAR